MSFYVALLCGISLTELCVHTDSSVCEHYSSTVIVDMHTVSHVVASPETAMLTTHTVQFCRCCTLLYCYYLVQTVQAAALAKAATDGAQAQDRALKDLKRALAKERARAVAEVEANEREAAQALVQEASHSYTIVTHHERYVSQLHQFLYYAGLATVVGVSISATVRAMCCSHRYSVHVDLGTHTEHTYA
jgi:hypothetical protein